MIMLVVCQTAMGNDYVTVFKAGGNVCTPITIKSSAGEFVLTSEVRISKSLSWFEAFDCQGRKLMDPSGSVSVGTGKTTVRTYVFTTLFPTTQKQDDSEVYMMLETAVLIIRRNLPNFFQTIVPIKVGM